jgi:hypothetical protein
MATTGSISDGGTVSQQGVATEPAPAKGRSARAREAFDSWLDGKPRDHRARPALTYRENLISCVLGTWMLSGLYLDGWAHRNLDLHDSITTPYHGILYSGFFAFASWITWVVVRNSRPRRIEPAAIPVGYGIGLLGVAFFTVGGMFDQVWHLSLGVEQDINAFQSPTHWFLAIGMFLMVSSPVRAGWSSGAPEAPTLRQFAPTLWGLVLSLAFFGFVWNYMSFFIIDEPMIENVDFFSALGNTPHHLAVTLSEKGRILGIAMITVTTISLMGSVLLALRRWRLPFGSVALMFTVNAAAVNGIWEYRYGWVVASALIGGLTADWLIARIDPRPSRPVAYRLFAFAVPLAMWFSYWIIVFVAYEMNWPAEMWTGTLFMSSLVSLTLSVLMRPMDNPVSPCGDR